MVQGHRIFCSESGLVFSSKYIHVYHVYGRYIELVFMGFTNQQKKTKGPFTHISNSISPYYPHLINQQTSLGHHSSRLSEVMGLPLNHWLLIGSPDDLLLHLRKKSVFKCWVYRWVDQISTGAMYSGLAKRSFPDSGKIMGFNQDKMVMWRDQTMQTLETKWLTP